MGFFNNVGASLRERKRLVAAVLGGLCIALAAFFAGTWAGSSGAVSLTSSPAKAPASSAPSAPNAPHPMSGKMCCDDMKDMHGMPNMPGNVPNVPPR